MIFGPLSYHESQIGAVAVLKSHQFKCQFLGIGSKPIAKVTLASANQSRHHKDFEIFVLYMMKEPCKNHSTNLLDISVKK